MMVRAGAGRCGRGRRRGPRRPRPVRFFAEMCILHSRMTVGTALSSAKCTSRRPGAPRGDGRAVAAVRWRLRRTLPWARPADRGAPPGARGGAVCPNLPQRAGSRRSTERESLTFRAFIRGRSRPGAPWWQIWTRPRPGPPQESHAHHHALAHSRHRADPGPRPVAPDEKDPLTPFPGRAGAVVCPKVTRRPPFPPRRRHPANSARCCRPPGPAAAARLSPPGRRCGRWDP